MADADGSDNKGCWQKFTDGLSGFSHFLYNAETGQVMGRSGKSWAKIGFFYLIFYGFLAGFFSGMLAIFLTTINDPEEGGPKLTQYVENQPGLTRLEASFNFKHYNRTKGSNDITAYVKSIGEFLKRYKAPTCNTTDEVGEVGMPKDKLCYFNTVLLGDCEDPEDSLLQGAPCVYVKINKVFGWVPKSNDGKGFLKLTCSSGAEVKPAGFQISAFPFRGQKDFELPIVAVKINITETQQVDCYLEGKGIQLSDSYVPYRAYGRIRIN